MPTQEGFLNWVYTFIGVPEQYLPSDTVTIEWAYVTAIATVNPAFIPVPGPIYLQMVYNLAFHLLVSWTTDVPGLVYKTEEGVPYGYFAWIRKQNNMLGFTTGIVQASSDEGTSVSMVVPDWAKNLTMSQLNLTTTPWGRAYLGYAMDYGTNWGIS